MNYISFQELADFCQAQALADKLYPSDEAIWRLYCRRYSKLFSTPLHEVTNLDPAYVMLAVYEEQLDDVDVEDNLEGILDIIYMLEDPEYAKEKRDELKKFIKEAEEEEDIRLEEGRPIHKLLVDENQVSTKKVLPESTPIENKVLPQSGGINLSYLEQHDKDDKAGEF